MPQFFTNYLINFHPRIIGIPTISKIFMPPQKNPPIDSSEIPRNQGFLLTDSDGYGVFLDPAGNSGRSFLRPIF
jgi:hypothetical protein